MGVDLQLYRSRIGVFRVGGTQPASDLNSSILASNVLGNTSAAVVFIQILLLMSGVEPNPGPTGNITVYN